MNGKQAPGEPDRISSRFPVKKYLKKIKTGRKVKRETFSYLNLIVLKIRLECNDFGCRPAG
jgi:hypothetical protein